MTFEEHVRERIQAAIRSISVDDRADVYVVSLFVYDENDDPRAPTVTVGFNTEAAVTAAVEGEPDDFAWGTPSDEDEARWNFAFWLQNELDVIAEPAGDPAGNFRRASWIKELGLDYSDEDEENDFDAATGKGEQITAAFVELLVKLTRELHETGILTEVFGRPVPVLIHELEYYDEIADQNRRANPPGLIEPFTTWVEAAGLELG